MKSIGLIVLMGLMLCGCGPARDEARLRKLEADVARLQKSSLSHSNRLEWQYWYSSNCYADLDHLYQLHMRLLTNELELATNRADLKLAEAIRSNQELLLRHLTNGVHLNGQ